MQPEAPNNKVAAASSYIGISLGLLDDTLTETADLDSPSASAACSTISSWALTAGERHQQ